MIGIKYQLRATTLVPLFIIAILFVTTFNWQFSKEINLELKNLGYAYLHQLIPIGEYALLHNDGRTLEGLIDASISNEQITSVAFYDKYKHLVISRGNNHAFKNPGLLNLLSEKSITQKKVNGHTINFIAPITLPKSPPYHTHSFINISSKKDVDPVLGWLSIELDTQSGAIKSYRMFITSMFILLLGLLLGLIVNHFLSKRIFNPINRLRRSMKQILQNEFETTIKHTTGGEIGLIEEGSIHLQKHYIKSINELNKNIEIATQDIQQTLESLEEKNINLCLNTKKTEDKSRKKSEFIANMTHEIRTPMNGVIGFTNILLETPLTPSQKDYVNTIKTSGENLINIVNDILDFSKIDAGQLQLDMVPLDVRSCIDEVLTLMAPSAYKKQLDMHSVIYKEVPMKVLGDPLRFKQVLINLIGNAIKFTGSGSVKVITKLKKTTHHASTIEVEIIDTGIGLKPLEQKKLFQAYKQADISTTRRFGGTGLGLVISQKIAEKMGGEINLTSQPGKGTTFTFHFTCEQFNTQEQETAKNRFNHLNILSFDEDIIAHEGLNEILMLWSINVTYVNSIDKFVPYLNHLSEFHLVIIACKDSSLNKVESLLVNKQAFSPPIFIISKEHTTLSSTLPHSTLLHRPVGYKKIYNFLSEIVNHDTKRSISSDLPQKTSKHISILIAEDDSINQLLFSSLLDKENIKITIVNNGLEALDKVKAIPFDLILLDLQMPLMDGVETAKTIRNSGGLNQNKPIIAISANISHSQKRDLYNLQINDSLEKPFDEKKLLALISQWTTHNAIDWNECVKRMSGKEKLAKEMLDKFVESLLEDKVTLIQAKKTHSIASMQSISHRLYGASCYIGIPKLRNALRNFELLLNQDQPKVTDIVYQDVLNEINAVLYHYENLSQ